MKVLIRADASTQIGTGHVIRCLTLAGDLKRLGIEVSFICQVSPGDLCGYIEGKGFKVYSFKTEADIKDNYWEWLGKNWLPDARRTEEILLNEAINLSDKNSNSIDNQALSQNAQHKKEENTMKL